MHKKFLGPKMDSQRSHTFGHSLIATLYVHGEWTGWYGVGGVVAYCIIMTDPYTGLGVWGFGYSGPGLDKNHISGLE